MEEENLVDFYLEQLKDTTEPAILLAKFYSQLFDSEISVERVTMFKKFVRLYGRFTTFTAILDCTTLEVTDHNNIYGLIHYFCKKTLEKRETELPIDLTEELKKKKISKRIKLNSPFEKGKENG